jgi:hypothetical protein
MASNESKIRTDCQIFGLHHGCESCNLPPGAFITLPRWKGYLTGTPAFPSVRLGFPVWPPSVGGLTALSPRQPVPKTFPQNRALRRLKGLSRPLAARGLHLAPAPKIAIIGPMSKSPRVIFKFKRLKEGDWQIEAHYPGAEIRYISGFKSKVEVDEWLAGSRRIDWLRSQGYAK